MVLVLILILVLVLEANRGNGGPTDAGTGTGTGTGSGGGGNGGATNVFIGKAACSKAPSLDGLVSPLGASNAPASLEVSDVVAFIPP